MKPLLHNVPPDEDGPANHSATHRRVEITVEREVLSLVYQPGAHLVGHCTQCGKDVPLLSAEAAAASRGISTREVYRSLDENKLHFQEPHGGLVLICSESLQQLYPTRQVSPGESR